MRIRLEWEPRDLWVGAFWNLVPGKRNPITNRLETESHVYICLIPTLPIHVSWVNR